MTFSNKACILWIVIPRFGEAYDELPKQCWLSMPELSPDHWELFPTSGYEALVGDLMSMGTPVPGHPAACKREGCAHTQVWHQHRTRLHRCEIEGCQCTALMMKEAGQ